MNKFALTNKRALRRRDATTGRAIPEWSRLDLLAHGLPKEVHDLILAEMLVKVEGKTPPLLIALAGDKKRVKYYQDCLEIYYKVNSFEVYLDRRNKSDQGLFDGDFACKLEICELMTGELKCSLTHLTWRNKNFKHITQDLSLFNNITVLTLLVNLEWILAVETEDRGVLDTSNHDYEACFPNLHRVQIQFTGMATHKKMAKWFRQLGIASTSSNEDYIRRSLQATLGKEWKGDIYIFNRSYNDRGRHKKGKYPLSYSPEEFEGHSWKCLEWSGEDSVKPRAEDSGELGDEGGDTSGDEDEDEDEGESSSEADADSDSDSDAGVVYLLC